jgi:hypothetical protein
VNLRALIRLGGRAGGGHTTPDSTPMGWGNHL